MTIPETIKDLTTRKEALHKFLDIDRLQAAIADEEQRTEAADFWNDPKEAKKVMLSIKSKKTWTTAYQTVSNSCDDMQVMFEFFNSGDASEEEMLQQIADTTKLVEELEFKNMLRNDSDRLDAVLSIDTTRGNRINQTARFTFRRDFDVHPTYSYYDDYDDEEENVTWQRNTLEVNLRGSFGYNATRATATAATNLDTYTFSYGLSAIWNWWFGLNLSTDINQNSRRGYAEAAMNTNQWIWNAQAAYSFLSRRQAIVTLRWNDILQQRDMVNRTISATSRTDSDSDRITSYVMLSFTYRFNLFGQ